MKKILSTLALGAMSLCAFAQSPAVTTKVISNSGGKAVIAVYANIPTKTKAYTAFGIDLQLPSGMTVTKDPYAGNEGSIYYADAAAASNHIIMSSVGKVGDGILRVAGMSEANHSYEKRSGELFRFEADVTSSADITIANADVIEKPMDSFRYSGGTEVTITDAQHLLNAVMGDKSYEKSDVNGDSQINITDAQYLLNYVMGSTYSE